MTATKLHYLDVVDGEFRGTTAADLEELFKEVEKSEHRDHIVVHFHGGLVLRETTGVAACRRTARPCLRSTGNSAVHWFQSGRCTLALGVDWHESGHARDHWYT